MLIRLTVFLAETAGPESAQALHIPSCTFVPEPAFVFVTTMQTACE